MIKIGFIQFNPIFGKVNENNKKIESFVSKVKADLLVLPELCNTGYMFKDKNELKLLAEEIPKDKTTKEWTRIAKENNVFLVGGLAEKDSSDFYDSSVLIGPKGFVGKYRKTHLFLNEKKIFKPGDLGFNVFDTSIGRIGLMICFDYMFPEAARVLALKGADIICNPVNLVSPPSRVMTVMRARALENGVYAIAVNRIGEERGHVFQGGSEIIGPRMETLVKAEDKEEVEVVEVDLEKARDKKYTELNDLLKDRRIEFYKEIVDAK
jgi:predicted amidohydrolase